MARLSWLLLTIVSCVCVVSASPITGMFNSPDAGSDFYSGRWSESFAGGYRGAIGNVIHAASWSGTALAGQWELSGLVLSATPTLIQDTVNLTTGNGMRTYLTTYSGGTLSLMDTGPWWNTGDGGTTYVVDVDTYENTTVQVIQNWNVTTFRTTAYMSGTFHDYSPYLLTFAIGSALPLGSGTSIPSDYPAFVGDDNGDWGAVQKITMEIVPEPATLSLLALGGLTILRRRNRLN